MEKFLTLQRKLKLREVEFMRVEPKRDELIGFWQELIIAASCSRALVEALRVNSKKPFLVEVLQFEYQLQAASCNNCKQLDKALSLEQRETNHFKWIKDQSI